MKAQKEYRVTIRLSAELQKQAEEACQITGLDQSTVLRECLKAFVREVAVTGAVRLPITFAAAESSSPAAPLFISTAKPDPAGSPKERGTKPPSPPKRHALHHHP